MSPRYPQWPLQGVAHLLTRWALLLVAGLAMACSPVVALPGPAVAAPSIAEAGLVARDGAKLPLRIWRPADGQAPRAILIALHGFNDYRNFFATAGGWFAERGIQSYAYDQRGFGAAPNRGLWPGRRRWPTIFRRQSMRRATGIRGCRSMSSARAWARRWSSPPWPGRRRRRSTGSSSSRRRCGAGRRCPGIRRRRCGSRSTPCPAGRSAAATSGSCLRTTSRC